MIYFFIIVLLLIFVIRYDVMNYNLGYNFSFYLTLIFFILISGLRYKVGGDTLVYFEEYDWLPNFDELSRFDISNTRYDFLWILFSAFCKLFSKDYFFMQFVQSFVINCIYFYYIYKNSNYRFTALLLYFVFGFLYFNTEIMREAMAVAIFLLSLKFYFNKKWIWYYCLALIAFFTHSSALILFFFPFASVFKINNTFFYSILIIAILSGVIWQLFNSYINMFLLTTSIEIKAEAYLNNQEYTSNLNGILLNMMTFVIIPLVFVFYAKRVYDSVIEVPLLWLYIILGVFTIFNATIFSRFQNYLFFPYIVFLSNLLHDLKYTQKPIVLRGVKITLILLLLFVGRYYSYFSYEPNGRDYMYQRYFPYNSIIYKKDIPGRE